MHNNKHSILILCDAFGPPAYVPRVRNLAINLQKMGWKVQVISELMSNCQYETNDFPLALMHYYSPNKVKFAYQWLIDKLWLQKEYTFTRFVEQQINVADFDIILCSTFNVFPLLTAQKLAKKYHKPLVVDLRDIAEQWGETRYLARKLPTFLGFDKWLLLFYEKRNIRLRNKVLQAAELVTTISPWHVQFLKSIVPNVHLIYNGFNQEEFYAKDVISNKFIISYTGRIYDFELRNPHFLFAAVEQLIQTKQIAKQDIELQFYIDEPSISMIEKLAQQYHIEDTLRTYPYVSNSHILPILHNASIALILSNKTTGKGPFGIMTTKFYEALGVEKPVLCVRSDEDCLAAAIEETNAGIAAKSIEETTAFILDKYEEWKQNGFTHQPVRNKFLFTRQEQAKQFAELLRLGQKTKDKGQRTKDEGRRIIEARLISVIIPIYNAGKYLETCLHSLRLQTYSNLQVIMIDDGSTDHSAHIAQRFVDIDERFMLIRQANAGQSAARNRGLEKATGAFVSFVDADDLLDVDYYDLLVHNIGTNDVLQTGYTLIDEQGEQLDIHYPNSFYQYTTPWSRFFRRDWLCEHNLRFEEGQIYEDVLFSIDVWLANPTHSFYPYSGYQYRINPTSTTAKKHDTKNLFSLIAQRQKKAKGWHKLLILHTRIRLWLHFLLGRK